MQERVEMPAAELRDAVATLRDISRQLQRVASMLNAGEHGLSETVYQQALALDRVIEGLEIGW